MSADKWSSSLWPFIIVGFKFSPFHFYLGKTNLKECKTQVRGGGSKVPNHQKKKRSPLTSSSPIWIRIRCQIWAFYTKVYGVNRADRQEKYAFWIFFGVQSAQFSNLKKKTILMTSTPIKIGPICQIWAGIIRPAFHHFHHNAVYHCDAIVLEASC